MTNAVAYVPWNALEWRSDEIAKTALRHGVLIGEKPVVGIQPDLMPPLHRPCKHRCTELSSERCRCCLLEEDPHMGTPS